MIQKRKFSWFKTRHEGKDAETAFIYIIIHVFTECNEKHSNEKQTTCMWQEMSKKCTPDGTFSPS